MNFDTIKQIILLHSEGGVNSNATLLSDSVGEGYEKEERSN